MQPNRPEPSRLNPSFPSRPPPPPLLPPCNLQTSAHDQNKDRRPFLRDPHLRARLHSYLGEISKRLDCPPILVGGVEDHVHLLARFGRTTTQAEWIKELKRVSTDWLHQNGVPEFHWQAGYATFSVSQSNLEKAKDYIARQESHHQNASFQDELRVLLGKHQIDWDEAYIWD